MFSVRNFVKNRVQDDNLIPHTINLFWTGSTIPDEEAGNLISFLNNLPDSSWKVNLWLTNFQDLYNAKYFKTLDGKQLPKPLVLKNVNDLLNDKNLFKKLEKMLPIYNTLYPFKRAKNIIRQELIGLGNVAAAKDALVPLILFSEGGYYFDFDSKAINKIKMPSTARYGFLLPNKGKIVAALASERNHPFCALSLTYLIAYYTGLPKTEKLKFATSSKFIDIQYLRNIKDKEKRSQEIINTSGKILFSAYKEWLKELEHDPVYLLSLNLETPFPLIDHTTLAMNIKSNLKRDGSWREPKQFKSFSDENISHAKLSRKI